MLTGRESGSKASPINGFEQLTKEVEKAACACDLDALLFRWPRGNQTIQLVYQFIEDKKVQYCEQEEKTSRDRSPNDTAYSTERSKLGTDC